MGFEDRYYRETLINATESVLRIKERVEADAKG